MLRYNVSWNYFSEHLTSHQKLLYEESLFSDVTLVTDDKKTFKAHKTVLSGASDLFQELLSLDPSSQPMLFIRGVSQTEMEALLKFIYLGECQLPENQLDHFTQTGLELGVRELMHIGVKNEKDSSQEEKVTRNSIKKINIHSEIFSKVDIGQNNQIVNSKQRILNYCFQNSKVQIKREYPENINTQLKLKESEIPNDRSYIKTREKQDSSTNIVEKFDPTCQYLPKQLENTSNHAFCQLCKTNLGSLSLYEEHRTIVHSMEDVFCNLCYKKFEKISFLHNHRAEKHQQNDEIIVCFCASTFENARQYMEHFNSHKESGFKCPKCNTIKPFMGRFQHFKKCEGIPVKEKQKTKDIENVRKKCDFCDKHKNGQEQMQLHVSRLHPKCDAPNCDFVVRRDIKGTHKSSSKVAKVLLKYHIMKEHPISELEREKRKWHKCPHCSFKSKRKSNFARHLTVCKEGKPQLMISF